MSDADLRVALNAAELGIWTWDIGTGAVSWSAECFRIHGMPEGSFAGTSEAFFQLVHPEDRQRVDATVRSAIAARRRYACEFRILRPDGSVAWVSNHGCARCDVWGTPVVVVGTIADITAVRQTSIALQAALSASRTGIFHWDIRSNALHWDDELDRLFGLQPGAAVRSLEQFHARVHEDDRQAVTQACEQCAREGGDFELEFRVVWPDGSVHWLYDKGETFRDGSGQPAWMTGACVDITGRKQVELELRASEERFRIAMQASAGILWTNDPSGRMVDEQPGWAAFTGQSHEEYKGYGWAKAVHPDDAQLTLVAWNAAVATDTRFVFEHRVRRHDGVYRWFSIRALPVRDESGCVRQWVGMHTDVSRMREAQATIERQNRELIAQDARKDVFLATLSHELRNPLTPVRTAAELLGTPGLSTAQLGWAKQVIQRQVRHMSMLLDDLLDVARITQGKLLLKPEPAVLSAVLDVAVETVRPNIDRKRQHLSIDVPKEAVLLQLDPLRIAQAVSNLLTNASKYTCEGGAIRLGARVEQATVVISVEDDGIGIATEELPRLFHMFSQLQEGTIRAEGGLGVGLALVKGLVDLHGGSVSVSSPGPGGGSRFSIRLPLVAVAADAEDDVVKLDGTAAAPASARRILVVDDNVDAAETLGAFLQILGDQVRVAHGGIEALRIAGEFRPHVAVLDIGMAGMDGYALATALRREQWGRAMALVAVTGWGQDADRQRASNAGFDAHFTKPVEPHKLHSAIAQLVAAAGLTASA